MTGDDRPRWSFNWLLRIQRTGRDRRERAADDAAREGRTIGRWVLIVVIGGVLIIEIALGLWLGVIPR